MNSRGAARMFVVLAFVVAVFQLALVFGAPWGQLTWGGRFPGALPISMRGVAAISLVLMLGFAYAIAARAGLVGPSARRRARGVTWVVVAYCALGVVANAVTPSAWERIVWLPVVSLMFGTSLWVARVAARDDAHAC